MALVSWYKGENNLIDSVGPTSGVYWHGAGNWYDNNSFTSGVIDQAILIDFGDVPLGVGLIISNTSGTYNFDPSGSFSYSFYINVDSNPTYIQDFFVISKNEPYPYASSLPIFDCAIRLNNETIVACVGNTCTPIGGTIPYDDAWHKVLITYEIGNWRVWIDDIETSNGTYLLIQNNYPVSDIGVGLGIPMASFRLRFGLDELKVYSEAVVPVIPTGSKKLYSIICNQRRSPYLMNSTDKIQIKYNLYSNNKTKLSYLKNIPLELNLNLSGWQIVNSGITDKFGGYTFHQSCSGISTKNCLSYVSAIIDNEQYKSNVIRLNFSSGNYIYNRNMPESLYNFLSSKTSLVAWYPFCENIHTSGYTPNVGNQTDGSELKLSLSLFGSGEYVGSGIARFNDGQNGFLTSSASGLQISGDLTIFYKCQLSGVVTSETEITMLQYSPGETPATNVLYQIKRDRPTGALNYSHEYNNGSDVSVNASSIFPNDGNYHTFALTRNTVLKTYNTYIDNSGVVSVSYSNNPTGGGSTKFYLPGSGVIQTNGLYKNLFIFNECLSSGEIQILKDAGDANTSWFDYSNWNNNSGYVLWK